MTDKTTPVVETPIVLSPARIDADALGDVALKVSEAHGEVTIDLAAERIVDACQAAQNAGYDFLVDLAATDYLGFAGEGVGGYWSSPTGTGTRDLNAQGAALGVVPERPGDKRFAISYQLLNRSARPARRLRLRLWVDEGETVPSIVTVFPVADYPEREAFDLMGVTFTGHPNLERIFLPDGWDGHPHRKDYPIGGEPVQFSEEV